MTTSYHGIERRRPAAEVRVWDVREPLPASFESDWAAALAATGHGHFAMSLDYLRWEARHGHPSRALLLEDAGRRGAVVQRWELGRWVSGWPWRWQALICDSDPFSSVGMTASDAGWLHENLCRFAGRERILTFLPHAPARGVPGWAAGATVIQGLTRSDEELFEGMEPSKRRLAKRARGHQVEIATGERVEDFRAFYDLQVETKRRRGLPIEAGSTDPAPGEQWREWELPWMWLLLARRDGEVMAGVGDGILSGGAMQGRTAAATLEARRVGVTVLLGYEELRRGRDLGHRWFNYGGDTPFKREMSGRLGRRIRVFGWLGAGRAPRIWLMGEAALRGLRPTLARLRQRMGLARAGVVTMAHALAELAISRADLPVGI